LTKLNSKGLIFYTLLHEKYSSRNKEGEELETKLVSIKQAAKIFNFPVAKLYRLVDERQAPYIELENLSGSTSKKINTKTFAEWLDGLAKDQKVI